MQLDIHSPYCWDGKTLDWDKNNPNMAFPQGGYFGSCPASHPVVLPSLFYRIVWELDSSSTPTSEWYLSSDVDHDTGNFRAARGISAHADWFGGWHRDTLNQLTNDCMRPANMWCHPSHMGNGDIVKYLGYERTYSAKRSYTPEELLTTCPIRSTYDGNRKNVAYCVLGDHDH